jgi:predicted dehydrogenase
MDTLLAVVGEEIDEGSCLVSIDSLANHVLMQGRLTGGALCDITIRHVPVFATGFAFEVNGSEGTLVASIDGAGLAERGIRSLGEQINQVALRGGRSGEQVAPLTVPAEHRWVPDTVPSGPPLSIAQAWRRFAESIDTGTHAEPDFALAVRRHELFELARRASGSGLLTLRDAPS